jgi:hypothetical protein
VSLVLIHNNAHRREAEARSARRTKAQVRDEFYWNLWRRALTPFKVIADGVDILLLESWDGGGIISWHVRAHNVVATPVADKDAAIRAIARHAGKTRRWVLSDPYTRDRPDDITTLIYWTAQPVKRLDVPKPSALKVLRNGWLVTDDATLAAMGVPLGGRSTHSGKAATPPSKGRVGRGQGRRLDVEAKQAVERQGELEAENWCRRRGWTHWRRGTKPHWDFEAVDPAGRRRYIEVKGTTGGPETVEVTAPEVREAKAHGSSHMIVIVHDIDLRFVNGAWKATGGSATVYDPWKPVDSELTAVRYKWKPRPGRYRA